MATSVNGFNNCEICPYGSSVFSESDFTPALMTHIAISTVLTPTATEIAPNSQSAWNFSIAATTTTILAALSSSEPGCTYLNK